MRVEQDEPDAMSGPLGNRNQAASGLGRVTSLQSLNSVKAAEQLIGIPESELSAGTRRERRLLLRDDLCDARIGVCGLGQAQQVSRGRILTLSVEAAGVHEV